MSGREDLPPVPKIEQSEEEEFDESSNEADDPSLAQEPAQVQKRKGGRKPVSYKVNGPSHAMVADAE